MWTSDKTEFVVVYFLCVLSVHAQFMMCVIGSRIVLSDKIDFISISRMLAHERSSPPSSLSLPHLQPHQPLRSRCRSISTATIHRMRSMALWPKQPLLHFRVDDGDPKAPLPVLRACQCASMNGANFCVYHVGWEFMITRTLVIFTAAVWTVWSAVVSNKAQQDRQ